MRQNIYPQYVKNSPEAHVYLTPLITLQFLFRRNRSTKYFFVFAQSDVRVSEERLIKQTLPCCLFMLICTNFQLYRTTLLFSPNPFAFE